MSHTKDELDIIWNKAYAVDGYDEQVYRKDACGAWIQRDKYGKRDSAFGWEIDRIKPLDKILEDNGSRELFDSDLNKRPLHWMNVTSKGRDYPQYTSTVEADGERNVLLTMTRMVSRETQESLKPLNEK